MRGKEGRKRERCQERLDNLLPQIQRYPCL
jgi:hypothetical protein